jgi:hypothetical protein
VEQQFRGPLEVSRIIAKLLNIRSDYLTKPMCRLYRSRLLGLTLRLLKPYKFRCAGCGSMLVSMSICNLSFQTNVVNPTLVLKLTPPFQFQFFGPNTRGMSFLLGRTISHEFILCPSIIKNLGDKQKLSINGLCLKSSTLGSNV